ncbi:MAG: energy transducer TonB [Bacteroidota bacterium]
MLHIKSHIKLFALTVCCFSAISLSAQSNAKKAATLQTDKFTPECGNIFKKTDKNASFPGGKAAMSAFTDKNLKYPASALKTGAEGTSLVAFVVDKYGALSQFKIAKSSGNSDLDREALRVAKLMPVWQPAENNMEHGPEKVCSEFLLPLNFILGNEKASQKKAADKE